MLSLTLAMVLAANEVRFGAQMASVPPADGWETVVVLSAGTAIRVTETDGTKTVGTFVGADSFKVTVAADSVSETIERPKVTRVERVERSHKIRNGFLIGAAGGFALAATTVRSNLAGWYSFMTLSWGGVGAAAGSVTNAIHPGPSFKVIFQRH